MKPFCSPRLRLCGERVDRQKRIAVLLAKGFVRDRSRRRLGRRVAYLGRDAFHRLEDRMEIVLLEKFGFTDSRTSVWTLR